MSKIEFKSFKQASKYSKNLAEIAKTSIAIHRERSLWWVDDTRLDWAVTDSEKYAECTSCKKPVNFQLLDSSKARKEFKATGKCQICQESPTHCYICKEEINGSIHNYCCWCKRIICPNCGICKCSFDESLYAALKFNKDGYKGKGIEIMDIPVCQKPIEHFKQTVDSPTLVLIDMAFLSADFKSNRKFYADLYPSKSLPTKISESALVNALCKYIQVNKDKATFFAFHQSFDRDVFDDKQEHLIKRIRCKEPTYFEMQSIIDSAPEIKRLVIMADDRGYISPINMLLRKGYAIGLIKHKQEGDSDESHMPPELPYQFSYYVVGECLGLRADEL